MNILVPPCRFAPPRCPAEEKGEAPTQENNRPFVLPNAAFLSAWRLFLCPRSAAPQQTDQPPSASPAAPGEEKGRFD